MAKIGQKLWKVANLDGSYTTTDGLTEEQFYENEEGDIISKETWSRLSIQAPPGTRFIIKQSNADSTDNIASIAAKQEIMVGRTGIYELPPGVAITYLKFMRPDNIIKDTAATKVALARGQNTLYNAEKARLASLTTTDEKFTEKILTVSNDGSSITLNTNMQPQYSEEDPSISTPSTSNLWEKYIAALNEYQTEYLEGIFYYNQGVQGVYKPSEDTLDLVNVIIDYVQE